MAEMCRICLSEGSQFLSIFSDTGEGLISEKIMFCATVELATDDKLPPNICVICMDKLDISYNFRRQCEAADCWLRQNLGLMAIKEDDIKEDDYPLNELRRKSKTKSLSKSSTKRKSARLTAKIEDIPEDPIDPSSTEPKCEVKDEFLQVKLEDSLNDSQQGEACEVFDDNGFMDFVNDNDEDSDYFGDRAVKKERKKSKKNKLGKKKKKKKRSNRTPQIYYDENGEITLTKPPIRYCCEHCGKYFTSSSYLKVHSKIHLGVKSFECSTCGKKFSTRDYLRKHARTHSDVKLYKCQYCPKGFNDWGSRQKHERIHRKEKPYVCDICGKKFTYSYTMTKHKLIHSGLKMFSCDICKRKFTMKYHLKSHQMRVHKELFASGMLATSTNPKINVADSATPPIVAEIPNVTTTLEGPPNGYQMDDIKPLNLQDNEYGIRLKAEPLMMPTQ